MALGTPDDPIRISWSMLRTHEECHQKAFLMRTHRKSPAQNLRNYFHGMVVDSAMREWLANPDRRPGGMRQRIDVLIDKTADEVRDTGNGVVRWRGRTDRDDLRAFCTELVDKLEPLLNALVVPYQHTCGYRFGVVVNAGGTFIKLSGELDLLVQDNGWHIWDLKGTADDQYWRKVLGQLIFYDIAIGCLFNGVKSQRVGLIQPMCPNQVLTFAVSDDDRRAMWARIIRMAGDIKYERNQCKESAEGCHWCEVKHACPRFKTLLGDGPIDLAAAMRTAAKETP